MRDHNLAHVFRAFTVFAVPYASLLLNGFKTLETRGSPILQHLEGSLLAIHLGRKDWPESKGGATGWVAVAPPAICNAENWQAAMAVPSWMEKGMIAGVVRVGATRTTEEWASLEGWDTVEQRALVPRANIAKYSTEISGATWLQKGRRHKGAPNIWMVTLSVDDLDYISECMGAEVINRMH